jgi:hypothetical protein
MTRTWRTWTALWLLAGCGGANAPSDASTNTDAQADRAIDQGGQPDTGALPPSDAADGPACTYRNYTQDEYAGFVDGGVYGNLPCGGCAPASQACSPNGNDPGHRYVCWAQYLYDLPPAPGTGCAASGVRVNGVDPTVWQVCCF